MIQIKMNGCNKPPPHVKQQPACTAHARTTKRNNLAYVATHGLTQSSRCMLRRLRRPLSSYILTHINGPRPLERQTVSTSHHMYRTKHFLLRPRARNQGAAATGLVAGAGALREGVTNPRIECYQGLRYQGRVLTREETREEARIVVFMDGLELETAATLPGTRAHKHFALSEQSTSSEDDTLALLKNTCP
mmetsp:Transcript_57069/g.127403  ORF Transcript_57069/g.127403 Transcript_57069/m.127403 type:complete len:191 (-) Transcript_57069:2696-3268(-)